MENAGCVTTAAEEEEDGDDDDDCQGGGGTGGFGWEEANWQIFPWLRGADGSADGAAKAPGKAGRLRSSYAPYWEFPRSTR